MAREDNYSAPAALSAEGTRVGIVNCKQCGAALLLDPRDKEEVLEIHDAWHRALDRLEGLVS